MSSKAPGAGSPAIRQRGSLLARTWARLLGFRSPSAGHLDDTKKQELIARFLLAEFNSLVDRARDCDQLSASRINFFLIIVGALAAGLGAASELKLSMPVYLWLAFFVCLFLFALGFITLIYSVRSAAQSADMFRLAGRTRCWFSDFAPEATPYFAFEPGDNRPHFAAQFWEMRGGEATVVTINSALAACLAAIAAYQIAGNQLAPWLPLVVLLAASLAVATWLLQWRFIKVNMRRTQTRYIKRGTIHFPDTNYKPRFEDR